MMVQIVTHPLYIRCRKVIESCTTIEQLKVAISYCKLAELHASPRIDLPSDGANEEILDHRLAWKYLMAESESLLCISLV